MTAPRHRRLAGRARRIFSDRLHGMTTAFDIAWGTLLAGSHAMAGLPWRVPGPDSVDVRQRLAAFPTEGLPLRAPVTVYWDEHQIPFVEATTDEDLATALGVVHVHLRWAQMEVMRRVAQGRLAELAGPLAIPVDRALRTLGITRAVPAIEASLPHETARWLADFVAGVNHAVRNARQLPAEFDLLGIGREPWEVADALAIGRLAAADVTWTIWRALLSQKDETLAASIWTRASGLAEAGEPGRAGSVEALRLASRAGSNAVAVAASRSANGSACIASDTHLPAFLPNVWLIAGCKSPSYHCIGLMVPGVPAVALGRNERIAWGGTNLHAASSDLFDVSALPKSAIRIRKERLKVRWRGEREIAIRETEFGPIVSDGTLLPQRAGRAIALRWIGHAPSDEITALLQVNRARDWTEFRAALEGFAAPGQNMVYADAEGHIGKTMAVHLPSRPPVLPPGPIRPSGDAALWDTILSGPDLPAVFDPSEGFVASANDEPKDVPILVGYFFSAPTRVNRLRQLLGEASGVGFDTLAALQMDVLMPTALPVRDRFARLLAAPRQHGRLLAALEEWDGRYNASSAGALAFEVLLVEVARALRGAERTRLYSRVWGTRRLLFGDLAHVPDAVLAPVLNRVAWRAERRLRAWRVWGRMHRLAPRHFLAVLPVLGRSYRWADWGADGGAETVLKTAHPLTNSRHHSGLVAIARHISDLSDQDANHFALLGGQDGWIGSTTMLDQVQLWRRGAYVRVPLRIDTVRATFPFRTELHSAS
jgi:penicillin G amidase